MGTHPDPHTVRGARRGTGQRGAAVALSVLSDFLLFCKLARHGVAPQVRARDATLDAAGYMLDKVGLRVRACGYSATTLTVTLTPTLTLPPPLTLTLNLALP